MTKTHTRLCTLPYRGPCPEHSAPTFVRRPIKKTHRFSQRGVEGIQQITASRTREILARLIQDSLEDKQTSSSQDNTVERVMPTWEEKVNRKRTLIAKCIANYPDKSASWISRHTRTHLQTVQRTMIELQGGMELETYTYNNIKPVELLDEVRTHCATVVDSFETLTDLKRRFPSFSKKKIRKVLKALGMRYAMLPKNRLNPSPRNFNSKKIVATIAHMAQVHESLSSSMLFCDEMKFPLYQTSKKKWMRKEEDCPQIYNRRAAPDTTIVAIALCSIRGFECVQLFTQEITGTDFAYFLHEAIGQLPSGHKYSILLDNATWHLAQPVSSSRVQEFLHFNEPGLFQLNLIENAFSGCRADFRKRPIVETLEEEARQILRIFFDPAQQERFKGYYRNHLRNLLKYLDRHSSKIENDT
jgi:hypothetical protein